VFLNVDPNPGPLPNVWGLGAVAIPVPAMRRGMGQASIGPFQPLDQFLQDWLVSLSGEPPGDAAVGCGSSGGAPCTSPEDAASMVYAIAAGQCQLETNDATMSGYVPDPLCADGGKATAAALYPQVLNFFQGFAPTVWQEEQANAASGNYYGPPPPSPCGPGESVSIVNGVVSCYGGGAPTIDTPVTPPSLMPGATGNSPGVTVAPSVLPASSIGPTSARLTNLSAPGQPLVVGDQWQLDISAAGAGTANVTGSSSQNGQPASSSNFGQTTNGQLTLNGTFGAGDVGNWVETWQVGNGTPAQVSLTVSQTPQQAPAGGTTATTTNAPAAAALPSWLTASVNILGVDVPLWGLIGGGVLAVMVMKD
jgi:hypothetical protein